MALRLIVFISTALLVMTLVASGVPLPDDPFAPVPPSLYRPVLKGTKSFVPVEPRPWTGPDKRANQPPSQTKKPAR